MDFTFVGDFALWEPVVSSRECAIGTICIHIKGVRQLHGLLLVAECTPQCQCQSCTRLEDRRQCKRLGIHCQERQARGPVSNSGLATFFCSHLNILVFMFGMAASIVLFGFGKSEGAT